MRISRQHFALAVRSFARYPGFAVTAVLSLALAIALNTTMYSVLDALVNPEINARQPGRLFRVETWGDYKHHVQEPARAQMLRDLSPVYESMTYVSANRYRVGVEYGERYAQVSSVTVAPNYFDVTRIGPFRGRSFIDTDLGAEMQPVIINERLAGTLSPDRDFPIGARVDVDGVAHPVIGVVHQGPSLFVLPPATTSLRDVPGNFLRLRDGVTPLDAERQMEVISHRLADAAGEDRKATGFLLKRADAGQFHIGHFHYALIAAVVAVLIIACANLANLQLARGITRSREFALRAALGAARRDIIVQLVIESFTLAVIGLAAGLVTTFWAIHLIAARIPPAVGSFVVTPQVSWRLFAVATAACLLATVIVGLYPAIKVSRVDPNELLKSGAGTGATKKHRRQYGVMVATEIGLALALLSGAAIVVRNALAFREIRVGFDPKPLVRATVWLRAPYDTVISRLGYANQLLASIRSIPDVANATIYQSAGVGQSVTVEQHGGPPLSIYSPGLGYRIVSPAYLRTFHLQVTKGRDFLDGNASEPEAIIDRRMAARLWPGVDPIGLRIKLGDFASDLPWIRVVGVAEEQLHRSDESTRITGGASAAGDIFVVAATADTIALRNTHRVTSVSVVARSETDPSRLAVTIRRYIPPSPLIWFVETSSMEDQMGIIQLRQSHDFVASLFALFATMALALAALGIYGIVNHSVNERKRELGVRLALGASARDIVYAVVRDGNPMVLAGVAVGLYLTKRTVLWLAGFSFEDDQYDAVLFGSMAIFLFAVAAASALIPAVRATQIDPVESLRCE
jgi:putative ABC transport system permease protein